MFKKTNLKFLVSCVLIIVALQLNVKAQYTSSTEAKINLLISQMTLAEKITMIHASSSFTSGGVKRLNIPELTTSDGPHGVRYEHGRVWKMQKNVNDSGTYLPTGNALAATWNPELGYAFGSVLGSEAKWRGKDVILGPGINIIRTPLNGRNFEYMSEDPFLISKMVVGYIKGVQDQGISACVKHFMGNNQETERTKVNVLMSERALREIYLPGFKAAVMDGKVNTIMGAYNKFRGQYCTQNDYLVNKILKGEWGFQGVMMSDWGAVHSTYEGLINGCDLEMGTDLSMGPNPDYNKFYFGDAVIPLVKSGKVPVSILDDKIRRILRVMYKTNMMGGKRTPGTYATKEHQATALKVAEEGIVLLKNDNHILPLKKSIKSIAVIGANADRKNAMGGGSSQVKATYEITPLVGLKNIAGSNIKISYSPGYKIDKNAKADAALIKEAADAASKADVAIIVGGWIHGYDYSIWADNAFDAEGYDKPNMDMPFGQNELIQAVLKANPRTIVVIMGGGGIDMSQWVNQTNGIIQAWYPGMEGGNALAKIIFGDVNPSGKLPMSFPKHLADCPAHKLGEYPGDSIALNYKEGIFVGYRYYDTYKVEPQFEFGHGLSYTTFAYDKLNAKTTNGKATVTLSVKNTGKVSGAEVVQLYIHEEKTTVERPDKELKAFSKVFLKPGEEKQVTLQLNEDAFKYFDEVKMNWVHNPGKYKLLVGSSSRDIRKTTEISL
jgi:beta-glucosidase